ncbi:hypothetical protein EYV94_25335 [Puteibacter caeruleilacunae]|nr:hypothetical protein EYV94_25335 [Puteibacter caeruleilacunae]
MLGIIKSRKKAADSKNLFSEQELLTLADKVVQRYAYTIPQAEREDVKMSMIEKFLSQQDQITEKFEGKSGKNTYGYAVLNRICCGVIRKEMKRWQNHIDYQQDDSSSEQNTLDALLIKDEIRLLAKVLILMNDAHKSTVFMASYYKLSPKEQFVSEYDLNYIENKLLELLHIETGISKGEIYNCLSKVVNVVERKDVKSDAVRMWLNKQMEIAISRLNGPFKRASYDKESLQVLFEYFYMEQ